MKKVYKTTNRYGVGWSDPRGMFSDAPTYKKPLFNLHKRMVEDKETGILSEYENKYIHGAVNGDIAETIIS